MTIKPHFLKRNVQSRLYYTSCEERKKEIIDTIEYGWANVFDFYVGMLDKLVKLFKKHFGVVIKKKS